MTIRSSGSMCDSGTLHRSFRFTFPVKSTFAMSGGADLSDSGDSSSSSTWRGEGNLDVMCCCMVVD